MKKLMIVLGLATFAFPVCSQVSVGLGGGMIRNVGENAEDAESLLGGELYGKYSVTDAIRVGINLGFYQKSYEVLGTELKINYAPISLSGEYLFLEDKFRPYVGLHLGILRAGVSALGESDSRSNFTVAPVVGAEYSITENVGINFNFKYGFTFYEDKLTEGSDNFSTISPNLGVFYKF